MNWQDADAKSRAAWFAFHGCMVAEGRAKFAAAVAEYAKLLADCNATERDLSAVTIADQGMSYFDAILADEVQRDLGV